MKEPLETVTGAGHRLGDYIREQRRTSQISLRQLSALAGVSNPYLSQIERGLRRPSADILQQIAKALRISAEALYVQAGILEHREASPVVDAVLADEGLGERQKQVLLEIYDSFRKEAAASAAAVGDAEPQPEPQPDAEPEPVRPARTPRTTAARPRTAGARSPRKASTPTEPSEAQA